MGSVGKKVNQSMPENETFEQKWQRLSLEVGNTYDADVILYSGEIDDATADNLIRIARQDNRRKNVVLMLATRGGSADAAYRIARCLQSQYTKFVIYIYGICKSAGTLIAIGAHEIILSDFGEFGPLDVQLGKRDELFENISGLNTIQALNSLNTRTLDFFRSILLDLRQGSRGQLSTKLASEIASHLSIGVYEKIYSQIDPVQLGSIERSINIASDYGKRLQSENVKPETVERLVSGYSSHSFVIDLKEAQTLFMNVRKPSKIEEELAEFISFVTRDPASKPFVQKLNIDLAPTETANAQSSQTQPEQSTTETRQGSSTNNGFSDSPQTKPVLRSRANKIVKPS